MNRIQLSRVLMAATILLLAVFEGYWLNKLYQDEYKNLKKEVDISFRDAIYKLQQQRFETDTTLVTRFGPIESGKLVKKGTKNNTDNSVRAQSFYSSSSTSSVGLAKIDPATIESIKLDNQEISAIRPNELSHIEGPIVVKNYKKNSGKDSSAKATIYYYTTGVPARTIQQFKKVMIDSVKIEKTNPSSNTMMSMPSPPPGLLEVILKRNAGKQDSSTISIKLDSGLLSEAYSKDLIAHLKNIRIAPKDSLRLPVIGKDPITISNIRLTSAVQPTQVVNKKRVDLSLMNNATSGKTSRPGSVSISFREDMIGNNQSPMIQFLKTNKTLNDSIPLNQIDSAYRDALGKSYKKLPYTILYKKYPQQTVRKADFEPDSSDQVITSKVFVGYNIPYSYQASFLNTNSFILRKMNMQIGGSIFLLLFVLLSFITLYRSLLAQRRLTIIKNDFISNITHELKTPIATVNVAIEALRDFGGLQNPARTKEYLDISVAELQRLGMLVDKVLKFSLFENKEIALQKESFDLLQLIKDVMDSMKLQFEKQQAVAELETIGENFMIDADKLHITSVVYNLLDNALKYSKEDPHIKVILIRHIEYFELRISDNGVGIPDAYRTKIFEQFFRVPNGDRHNIKGYGLGLSYVNHIVQKHMGFVEIETELGKGSTFIVKIAIADIPVVHFDKGRKVFKLTFKAKNNGY